MQTSLEHQRPTFASRGVSPGTRWFFRFDPTGHECFLQTQVLTWLEDQREAIRGGIGPLQVADELLAHISTSAGEPFELPFHAAGHHFNYGTNLDLS